MKKIFYLSIFSLLVTIACKSDSKPASESAAPEATTTQPAATPAPVDANVPANFTPTTAPQSSEPPQNAKGVWHFTCPKGCPGGGGGATACAKCGTTMVHNAAYHQQ